VRAKVGKIETYEGFRRKQVFNFVEKIDSFGKFGG